MRALRGRSITKTDPAFVEAFRTALAGLGLLGLPAFPTIECEAQRLSIFCLCFCPFREFMQSQLSSLQNKRVLLFKEMLEASYYPDKAVADDLARGFNLVGHLA